MPQNPRPRVRVARAADSDQVWPLARDFATSLAPRREAFEATWRALRSAPGALIAVAESDEVVVGYLLAHRHLTFLANGPVAWVEEVMVAEHRRRSGVGRDLMRHAEQWGRDNGAAYLALASRRAGAFSTALGYEESATFFKKPLTDAP
ncbi:MAG: GNAT family N-acetyltransferase [Cellulomonas sp.]|uniref:N-acetyltransferase n=1 Tax=Cellulomonas gelida TaxID=1712 RepID=A0A4Y3KIH4_9CELL|nr:MULTISPECIES: GNAT family N-acetyltransferase [Cellulomonas]MCR6648514.1 GNAT family N-acetyltransferase [Cellulomonas sp.]GEA83797.1 N-acetyltransferase [Cellulomonas gelida]GGL32200.1 N-acetyltransferase [Cellulomonas gelida]